MQVVMLMGAVLSILVIADAGIWITKKIRKLYRRIRLLWLINQLMDALLTIKPKLESEK